MNAPHASRAGAILGKVLGFSVGLTLVFTLVANLLPQVEGEAPVDEQVDLGALTMDSFVALGESLFSGKGTCTLCHNSMGRAPDILHLNMVETAATRLQDGRYQGAATDAEHYLRESMLDPGLYVVQGFGKKGSDDTESPMPAIDKPPIQLSAVEIDAIIAFLQSKDGNAVTVALPSETPAAEPPPALATSAPPAAATAAEALAKYTCTACHAVDSNDTVVGPGLLAVGARLGIEQIRQSIVDPDAVVADAFAPGMMPGDFADKMSARELELIVQFLAGRRE